jgi:SAM-dependent methyltransferase
VSGDPLTVKREADLADGWAVPDAYGIRDGYVHRDEPDYYHDDASARQDITWQPDVYRDAARIAIRLGAERIIDIGSGDGLKLVALHPGFAITGIDFGANLGVVRSRYPFGQWLEHDLDRDEPLPLTPADLTGAVVVCSDVIEHLRHPDRLLAKLSAALEHCAAIVLSTPERALTWGEDHAGPPPNPCHVREWTIDELAVFLDGAGFAHGDLTLTRSNDRDNELKTILALLFPDAATQARALPQAA